MEIVGGVVGFMIGGPLGGMVGMMAGRWIDVNLLGLYSAPRVQGPRLSDLNVQVSTFGAPIQRLWGRMRVAGNVIWADRIREVSTTETVGDNCMSSGQELTTYNYYCTFAVGLCRGPITGVTRIWADSKLIYDLRDTNTGIIQAPGLNFRLYLGTETQVADPTMESLEDAGTVPAYRGLAYIVLIDLPLNEYGNRIPSMSFEVATTTLTNVPRVETVDVPVSVWGSDDIAIDPQTGMHLILQTAGYWTRVNMLTQDVEREAHITDVGGVNQGFDMDRSGNIYAPGIGSPSQLYRLNSRSFGAIATNAPPTGGVYTVVVDREVHPSILYIFNSARNRVLLLDVLSFDTISSWSLPEDGQFMVTRNGDAYVLCSDGSAPGTSYILHIMRRPYGDLRTTTDISATIAYANRICYDAASDQLIIASAIEDKLAFFDASDLSVLGVIEGEQLVGAYTKSAFRQGPVDGSLWLVFGTTLNRIDVASRTVTATYSLTHQIFGGSVYDRLNHAIWYPSLLLGGGYVQVFLDRLTGTAEDLSTIVSDICVETGLTAAEIDVTDLTDQVRGFRVDDRMPGRTAIETLQVAYFFDGVETDAKIDFVKRNGSSVATVAADKLGAHLADSQPGQALVTTRQQELELPRIIDVEYLDYAAGYQVGSQREQRNSSVIKSELQVSVRLPIVLTADEARQIAAKHMQLAWLSRNTHQLALGREFAYLNPADVITVTEDGNTHTLRIERERNQGGVIALDCTAHDAAAYVSAAEGADLPADDSTVDYPGVTHLELLDTPLLSASTNRSGLYLATLGYTASWRGATIYKSSDGGVTWGIFAQATRDAIIGTAVDALADVADPNIWDEGGSVNVLLLDATDTLVSATEADVLDGANLAILGDEVIAFRTATLESDGSYTLSGLLRGRMGTEWATGDHTTADRFVLLDEADIHFSDLGIEDRNVEMTFRAVSVGMEFSSGIDQLFTPEIRNMMPLSPVHVAGSRDGSNNLTITWTRRTRLGGEWLDLQDVPLGETTEAYEVDVYSDASAPTVLRTISVTAATASYTAAQQTADGLTPGNSVTVNVYQISSVVGRGFATEATI